MPTKHHFFLPITPRATQRSRCTCRGRFAQVYTDPKYKEWREEAVPLLREIADGHDFSAVRERQVKISVEAVFPKPKATKLAAPRGDNDNLEKGLWDAITATGLWWKDDSQIVSNTTAKRWANPGEPPGYFVEITFL